VSLQVPVDPSCEYAGLPHIDHFGETIAFVGGINKPKLVQCYDRRARAPVDLAGPAPGCAVPSLPCFHVAPGSGYKQKTFFLVLNGKGNEASIGSLEFSWPKHYLRWLCKETHYASCGRFAEKIED